MVQELTVLFNRDLHKLADEIRAYRNENHIWITEKEIKNSAGNLCLHLVGNLNHFLGAILGKSGYIRNRDAEFSLRQVERKELLKMIDDTITMVSDTLSKLDEKDLENHYPEEVFNHPMSKKYFLIHLYGHFNYHLGQINYHRRLID